jgi:hypothetical protein
MKVAVCLHGYFGTVSTGDFSTSQGGYEHIKNTVLSKTDDVDFYAHCWQPEYEKDIIKLYNPKNMLLEEQIDFTKICEENEISHDYTDNGFDRENSIYKNATFDRILSFYYSRCESIKMALEGDYDWILTTRFDISERGGNEVNQIRFLIDDDSNYLYTTDWDQKNAGYGDMWFYGSKEIMSRYVEIYEKALNDFKPNSEYERALTIGWPDSNWYEVNNFHDVRQFSNETDKDNKNRHLMTYPRWRMPDSHLHHKWFCIDNNLYDLTRWV